MEDRNFYLPPLCSFTFLPLLMSDFSTVSISISSFARVSGKKATSSPQRSWPWHHDDPWLPEGEILESLLSVRGLEALRQLVCSRKVPTKICNIVFQQRIIQLNFFKMLWKAFSRDHRYLTKFDLLLQRLKQTQRLNNWITKIFSLFPSQTDPVLTDIFKKYSVHERPSTKNFSMEEW